MIVQGGTIHALSLLVLKRKTKRIGGKGQQGIGEQREWLFTEG